jgi:hypothetical protein
MGVLFNATFNNNLVISLQSILLAEEIRLYGENIAPYHHCPDSPRDNFDTSIRIYYI